MKNPSATLTRRQKETLIWIFDFIRKNGIPPTVREIGREFSIKSSSVHYLLGELQRKGYLRRRKLGARSLSIVDRTQESLKRSRLAVDRETLQTPFRSADLLPVSVFILYCKNRGIQTDKEQLEYYDRENLLLPVVRIKMSEIGERANLNPVRYEDTVDLLTWSGFGEQSENETPYYEIDGWLDELRKQNAVKYPAKDQYKPWFEYSEIDGPVPNTKIPGRVQAYEQFYSKPQIFRLWSIQKRLTAKICDEALFSDDRGWLTIGLSTRSRFVPILRSLQKNGSAFNRFLGFLNDVIDLSEKREQQANIEYDKSRTRGAGKREAENDRKLVLNSNDIELDAREILKRAGYTIADVERRRNGFVYNVWSLDPTRHWFDYLDGISDRVLDQSRGEYRFIRECHRITETLGWFLERLGQHPRSLKEMKVGIREIKACPYCDVYFKISAKTQKTCGDPQCVRDHRNTLKRNMRKEGR